MDPKKPRKSRATKRAGNSEEGNRQRGRPRITPEDQSTVERRRTQIRLAQRAYRERKETTISSLSRRVADLEGVIAAMGQTFTDLEGNLNNMGLARDSALAETLQQSSTQMTDLVRRGRHQSLEPEESDPRAVSPLQEVLGAREAMLPQRSTRPPVTTAMDQPWGYITHAEPVTEEHSTVPRPDVAEPAYPMLDWQVPQPVQDPATQLSGDATQDSEALLTQLFGSMGPQPTQQRNPYERQPNDDVREYRLPPAQCALDLPNELPAPGDYSYHESTFTRRLLRSSLEGSLRMLYNPDHSPEDVRRLGRFAFCLMKEGDSLNLLRSIWARPLQANLENWNGLHFYHIGGAGLHYPREFWDVNAEPPPANCADLTSMGPLPRRDPQIVESTLLSECEKLEFSEITGEWYDSNDVEQYLRTKGIFLDAQSRVVEINEEDVPGLEPETANSPPVSSAGPASPEYWPDTLPMDFPHPNPAFVGIQDVATNPWGTNDMVMTQGGNQNWDLANLDFGAFDASYNFNAPVQRPKPKKMMDVDAFVEYIVQQTTCLGRTLGFRKASVDMALTQATTEVLPEIAAI